MERNNTYGELINNKFSELLSVDTDSTWKGMKTILDREMPQKKRKWFTWFGTKVLIVAVILFSLFAAASASFTNFRKTPDVPFRSAAPITAPSSIQAPPPAEAASPAKKQARTLTNKTNSKARKAAFHESAASQRTRSEENTVSSAEDTSAKAVVSIEVAGKTQVAVTTVPVKEEAEAKRAF